MKLLLVRHGESVGNAEDRLQGQLDYPLTERGEEQASRFGRVLVSLGLRFNAVYVSPLRRARQTAELISVGMNLPEWSLLDDLQEISFGRLEGLKRSEIEQAAPEFLARGIESLADYGEFGGEAYEAVQARVERVRAPLISRHREAEDTVLIVGHGGFGFQLAKSLVCTPVPRVCLLKMGNCTSTLIQMSERRGTYIGELVWHVPLELWAGQSTGDGALGLFR